MHVPRCRLLTLLLWLAVLPHGLPEVDNFPCAGLCPGWLLQRSPNHVCRQPTGLSQAHRAELNCTSWPRVPRCLTGSTAEDGIAQLSLCHSAVRTMAAASAQPQYKAGHHEHQLNGPPHHALWAAGQTQLDALKLAPAQIRGAALCSTKLAGNSWHLLQPSGCEQYCEVADMHECVGLP